MFHSVRIQRTRVALLWLLMSAVFFVFNVDLLSAQALSPPTASPAATSSTTTLQTTPAPSEDVIYLPDEQGVLRRVPLNASLQDYLAFQKQLSSTNTESAAKYAIQSLDIQGQLVTMAESRQFAELIINVDVQVYQSSWTLINLKLQELVFTDPVVHQGAGEIAFNQRDRVQGVTLWLKGKGVHRLQIKGMLPIRSQQLWKRLQLNVPASTVSEFRMMVPAKAVQLRDVERYPLAQTEPRNENTQIRLVDLQEKLDLSWLEETDTGENTPIVNSFNSIQVRITEQHLEMNVTQRLEISQDPLSSMVFKLPTGWDLYDVRVDRSTITKQQTLAMSELQIDLDRPVSGRTELIWLLRRPMPSPSENVIVSPILLPIAKRQTTEVILQDHPEWQFQIGTGKNDKPISGLTTRQSANGPVYQFRTTPADLPIQIVPRQAVYATTLTASFLPDKQQCKLSVYFDVKVTQGVLRMLPLNWPSRLESEWKLLPSAEFQIKSARADTSANIRDLFLTRAISDTATIRLDFVRPISNDNAQYVMAWPTPVGRLPLEQFLAITDSRQVETKLDDASLASISSIPKMLWQQAYAETIRLNPLSKLYNVPPQTQDVSVTQRIVEQDMTARVHSSIQLLENSIDLTQTIDYRIEWSGTRQFDLDAPGDFSGNFQLSQNDNPLITQMESFPLEGGRKRIRLYCEQPLTGEVTLTIRTLIPVTSSNTAPLKPLVIGLARPSVPDVFISSTQISTSTTGARHIVLKDVTANSVGVQDASQNIYSFQEAPLTVSIEITSGTALNSSLEVRSCRLVSRMISVDRVATFGDFLLAKGSQDVRFRLPNSARVGRVLINTVPVPFQMTESDDFALITCQASASTGATSIDDTQLVTIEYQTSLEVPAFGLWRVRIPQPDFFVSSDLAIRAWRIEVFPQQHLFSWSTSIFPQFRWSFQNGLWVRKNDHLYQFPVADANSRTFHAYDFEVFGPTELRCRTISQSMLLLIGCGSGLLVALLAVLLLRNSQLPSLVALILGFSLIGAFLQGSMGGILLQPFLAGTALGVVALLIDQRFLHRGRPRSQRGRPITATATIGGSSITYHGRSIDWEAMADKTHIKAPVPSTPSTSSTSGSAKSNSDHS
ncbi:hypothetical protein [Lacunimicrobium album]